jgi:subtilisin-like proprotein convertase family protein
MLSARDADPGAHQKEKKSVLVDIIVSKPGRQNLTITLRSPYAWSLILNAPLHSMLS